MRPIQIAREDLRDVAALQAFYEAHGYNGRITDDAIVIGAREDGHLIGLVRLEPEHGVLVLRGMRVTEAYQRRGIGTRMLRFLEPECNAQDCYLLGHSWLESFYGRIAFVRIAEETLPPHLFERLMIYRQRGYEIPMLRRRA